MRVNYCKTDSSLKASGKVMMISFLMLFLLTANGCLRKPQTDLPSSPVSSETLSAASLEQVVSQLPPYSGSASVELNGNVPFFKDEEIPDSITLSDLDVLGRCGPAAGRITRELLPDQQREPIGMIKPSGWHAIRYDDLIEDKYLYNRCHLIAFELCGINADEKDLITGTRYLNTEGMLPWENMVRRFVEDTGESVLYRSTPVFSGNNLVADGIVLEARSAEDNGRGLQFCIYCYNVQPGITIDYSDGSSRRTISQDGESVPQVYILNTSSMKFHLPSCPSAHDIYHANKQEYCGNREELIRQGYEPCSNCNP